MIYMRRRTNLGDIGLAAAILLIVILATVMGHAQTGSGHAQNAVRDAVGHGVYLKSETLSATGTTLGYSLAGIQPGLHAVQVITTGSPAACTYDLQGSLDGVNYFAIVSATACTTSGTITWTVDKPTRWVRFNLATLSASSSATFHYVGTEN
jgi:hypothetical protein